MAELEPGLYMRWMSGELGRKRGGGSQRPALVEVTGDLLDGLSSQLSAASSVLDELPPEKAAIGVPLKIQLREKAYAKSNRPVDFLERAGMTPSAGLGIGQLVTRASKTGIENLDAALFADRSQRDYDVSTIESFSVWRPIQDGFSVKSPKRAEKVLAQAHDREWPIRIDFFPWMGTRNGVLSDEVSEELRDTGFSEVLSFGSRGRPTVYATVGRQIDLDQFSQLYGVRTVGLAPSYGPYESAGASGPGISVSKEVAAEIARGPATAAVVGVLDSGVSSDLIEPWVLARQEFDTDHYRNRYHGTFVAGLVVGANHFNGADGDFPTDAACVLDAQIMPKDPVDEPTILTRIEEVLEDHAGSVKVWNCSWAGAEIDPIGYGHLASCMDEWSEKYGVLFVQAVGNYEDMPVRQWPPPPNGSLRDGIAQPSEAVCSLAVGSIAHRGGRTPAGAPASYSRRGPSFGGQQKPDVVHLSGDLGANGQPENHGVWSVCQDDQLREDTGTSFATPIVSSIAANIWDELQASSVPNPSPALVKGLVAHSAALSNDHDSVHGHFLGAGVPGSSVSALFDDPESFTTVHEVDLSSTWLRAPFPIPNCLLVDGSKLRAEIVMTVTYAPPIDAAYGDECVRTSVEASFGVVSRANREVTIKGKVPVDKPDGGHAWESERIAEGKWSPLKIHRARFPQGVAGSEWGLRLGLTERETGGVPPMQRVYVILTLRGLEDGLPVRAHGHQAVRNLGFWNVPLSAKTELDIRI